jgi:exosortase E/protease (VPEID-CTERM system)
LTLPANERASQDGMLETARGRLPSFGRRLSLGMRLTIAAALLFLEKFALNFFVDFDNAQASRGLGAAVRIAQHWGFRCLVTLAVALALFVYVRASKRLVVTDSAAIGLPVRARWLLLHGLLLPLLAALSYFLYGQHSLYVPFALVLCLWLLLALLAVLALFAAMAPWALWCKAAREVGVLWWYALAAGGIAASSIQWSQGVWTGGARMTFAAVHYLLAPLIPQLRADPASLVIDTGRFAVEVSAVCSGLEGAALILAFCGAWLTLFHEEYIFPRALILIPVGVVLSFVLNIVRIATLVLIGHAGWFGMAVYGFHSQAGWIAFNCCAGLIALISRTSPWLNRAAMPDRAATVENPTAAYLVPFLAILAAGMAARALSTGFETLYFLRPMAAAFALCHYWPKLAALDWRISWRGPAVGIAVFVLWDIAAHWLTHATPMPEALATMPPIARNLWIAMRAAGTVLVIPLAEELAYRGFLLRRLVEAEFETVPFQRIGPWALLVSSTIFGLGHGSMWLPALGAGLLYGALLIRTGRMGEAVVAHATSNALVTFQVLGHDQWQLW